MRFCEHSSTFSSDPCETAYREGQRTVLLFIRSMIRDRKPLEDIAEMSEEQVTEVSADAEVTSLSPMIGAQQSPKRSGATNH